MEEDGLIGFIVAHMLIKMADLLMRLLALLVVLFVEQRLLALQE